MSQSPPMLSQLKRPKNPDDGQRREALGRDCYKRGGEEGLGYRNGVRAGRLRTAERLVDFAAPQVAGREAPFRSEIRQHLKRRTEALEGLAVELPARGLQVARA